MSPRIAIAFALFAVVACGGQTDSSDAGTDAGNGCPSVAPADSDDCTVEGLQCEYGSDPRWTCDVVATCKQGFWRVPSGISDPSCPTPTENPSSCPTAPTQNTTCSSEVSCRYGEQWCSCMMLGGPPMIDGGTPPPVWMCASLQTGCPSSRPKLGAACTQAGLDCDYAPCGDPSGLSVSCDSATMTWTENQTFCAGAN